MIVSTALPTIVGGLGGLEHLSWVYLTASAVMVVAFGLGVVTADDAWQLMQTVGRVALGTARRSPHVWTTKAESIRISLDRKVPYELDGGDRRKVRKLRDVERRAVHVCVPMKS